MKKTIVERQKYVMNFLSILIDNTCTEYAKSKMSEDDWISVQDGIKTCDINIIIGKKKKCLATLRNSSLERFSEFYDRKLVDMFENMENK